jgi:hypothetical protein
MINWEDKTSLKSDYYTLFCLRWLALFLSKISGLFRTLWFWSGRAFTRPLSRVYFSFNGNRDYLIILLIYKMIGIFILLLSAFNLLIWLRLIHRCEQNCRKYSKRQVETYLQSLSKTMITVFISIGLDWSSPAFSLLNAIIAKNLELFLYPMDFIFKCHYFLLWDFIRLYPAFLCRETCTYLLRVICTDK